MRKIKFRGLTLEGKFIYGDYRHIGFCPHIYKREQCYYEERAVEVAPESVAQLVGIDSNGKEVYEGDVIVDQHGIEYTAYLVGIADGETEFIRLDDEIETATLEFKVKDEQCT